MGGRDGPDRRRSEWISYRDFRFDGSQSDIRSSEMGQVSEIATYMSENPSIVAGIDGYADPRRPTRIP